MRLIDADAEIVKIEQEIQRIESQIKEWEDNRKDRSGYYDVDAKIKQLHRNIFDACSEIKALKSYPTAYDADNVKERLKELKEIYPTGNGDYEYAVRLDKAIEAVEAGGVNE